jgi:hypothetical protein
MPVKKASKPGMRSLSRQLRTSQAGCPSAGGAAMSEFLHQEVLDFPFMVDPIGA